MHDTTHIMVSTLLGRVVVRVRLLLLQNDAKTGDMCACMAPEPDSVMPSTSACSAAQVLFNTLRAVGTVHDWCLLWTSARTLRPL